MALDSPHHALTVSDCCGAGKTQTLSPFSYSQMAPGIPQQLQPCETCPDDREAQQGKGAHGCDKAPGPSF